MAGPDPDLDRLAGIIRRHAGRGGAVSIERTTRLLHDLGIGGDDLDDLVAAIEAAYAIDLSRADLPRHFPDEAYFLSPRRWLDRRHRGFLPFTVEDLLAAIAGASPKSG